jgi:hypothetical protein
MNSSALLQSADICEELYRKIAIGKTIKADALQILDLPDGIKYALQQLILIWNKTCLKV